MKRKNAGPVCHSSFVRRYLRRRVIAASMLALTLLPVRAQAQTGGFSGTVTDAGTGAGLPSTVQVFNWHGAFVTSTFTAPGTGAYIVVGLPPGTYFARTFVQSTTSHLDQAYSNVPCVPCPPITTTTPIKVTGDPATTPDINFPLSPGGGITGTVTDAGTGAPILSAFVQVYSSTGAFVKSGFSGSGGVYSVLGLPTGTYFARTFVFSNVNYLDEAYDNFPCSPSCVITAATPISVSSAPATTPGIDFPLSPGGGITGMVTDAVTGAPLAVTVQVYSSTGAFVRNTSSNAAGLYTVVGLATGTYFARTFVPSTLNYLDEGYFNIPCSPSCTITALTPIAVSSAPATTPAIDFTLTPAPGGIITGTVTDAGTGAPIPSVTVGIYSVTGALVRFGFSNAAGFYSVMGLATGTYFARTFVPSNLNYIDEAYNNVPCVPTCPITGATPIAVSSAPATTPNIDFPLSVGGIITGTITDAGTAAPGISIFVQIYSTTGLFVKGASSNAAGVYSVMGLPTGTYFARTGFSTTYVAEQYNNRACPHLACSVTSGTPIPVMAGLAGATTGNINFPLTPAGAADIVIDFGAQYGLWMLSADGSWRNIHNLSPVAVVTGDLDGNGLDDLVINFGPGIGVYAWMNHATWVFIHPSSPTQMVTGDLDNNGRDDIVFAFQGFGVWRLSDGTWSNLHGFDAARLAVGRLDAVAGDDLVVDFAGYGLFVFANNASWTSLHPFSAAAIVTADLDGNGRDEVVVVFTGFGLWVYRDTGAWAQLHGLDPVQLAVGHLDTGNREDLAVDFGPSFGVFAFRNNTTWTQFHGLSTEGLLMADRTASLSDEVFFDFGAAYGLWQLTNTGAWSMLHGLSPEGLAAGRFR